MAETSPVTGVEDFLDRIAQRAESIVADGETFLERHIAPDLAWVLAFYEAHLANYTAFQSNAVAAIKELNPGAGTAAQVALDALDTGAAEGAHLLGALLAHLSSKAPASKTTPVTRG